jgi:hypothetical protein
MQIEVALARNYDVLVNVLQECMSKRSYASQVESRIISLEFDVLS